ncbi:MAG: UDP-N-acetylmuramoyl-L-alanyl-D-glutamate--2,6-diaminopimelate ligase [Alphaproteobacteria bacterium]
MRLSDLIGHNGTASQIDIRGLTADSRAVEPGYLFAALPGTQVRGADYIGDALDQGAVAVLAGPDVTVDPAQAYLVPDYNPRRRLALMAARFFDAQPDTVVAVTGTNGKSSVVDFVRQIWAQLGHRAGSMGTLGVTADGIDPMPSLTTPDPVEVHRRLADLKQAGIDHLALEASSHGLAQHRLDGVQIKAAAFTNLSRDHLDYHATYEDYFLAKLRLFGDLLPPGGAAVLNAETPLFEELVDICWGRGLRILSVGKGGDLALLSREATPSGQALVIGLGDQVYDVTLPLIGDFQTSNALVAAGLVLMTGGEPNPVMHALSGLSPVRGRLEHVGTHPNGAAVYVDYAHTPDALRTVLTSLRPHTQGRLHLVFGCGGDRDSGKRPQMGAAAVELADRVIVTDDNPRHEDPAEIRRQIMTASPGALEVADRHAAIAKGLAGLQADDLLVIAGKGHEQGQIIGDEVLPFDDAAVVRSALALLEDSRA